MSKKCLKSESLKKSKKTHTFFLRNLKILKICFLAEKKIAILFVLPFEEISL